MKNLNKIGLALAIGVVGLFSSCDKEALDNVVPNADSSVGEDLLQSQALVVNAIANEGFTNLGVNINGVALAAGLDYKDISEYLGIETGEAIVDLVAEDGTVLASSSYTFVDEEIYNIVIVLDENGLNPSIQVLGFDPQDFVISDSFGSELGLQAGEITAYAANVINYTVGFQNENLFLGLDYIGEGATNVTGLLDLQYGILSGVFFGSDEILENIDVLRSTLGLDAVLDQLSQESNGVLDELDLGGVIGIGEILTGGSPAGLLGTIQNLIDGILGGEASPLDILSANLLDNVDFIPENEYTVLLLGTADELDFIVIDHNEQGLTISINE